MIVGRPTHARAKQWCRVPTCNGVWRQLATHAAGPLAKTADMGSTDKASTGGTAAGEQGMGGMPREARRGRFALPENAAKAPIITVKTKPNRRPSPALATEPVPQASATEAWGTAQPPSPSTQAVAAHLHLPPCRIAAHSHPVIVPSWPAPLLTAILAALAPHVAAPSACPAPKAPPAVRQPVSGPHPHFHELECPVHHLRRPVPSEASSQKTRSHVQKTRSHVQQTRSHVRHASLRL
jgi:hypothetical protein